MTVRRPKVLVDFDGVWTVLDGQARAVDACRVTLLAERSGWTAQDVGACLQDVEAEVHAHPTQHGWRWGDRITAFADEDPFLFHSALVPGLGILATRGHARCAALVQDLRTRGHADLTALAQDAFFQGCQAFLATHGHVLRPGAVDALRALLERADVVFCSNFTSAALEHTWSQHGFGAGTPGLSIRGNARKAELHGAPAQTVSLGGRSVAVDRPAYRDVLLQERPDLVVGDVLSMDLALPLGLRAQEPGMGGLRAVLVRTPFTPSWATELAGGRQDGLCAVDSPVHLVDMLPRP